MQTLPLSFPIDLSSEELGRRMTQLRKALSADTGEYWSQRDIARLLGVTQNLILRAERGTGSLYNMVRLLLFYHHYGYNINWVFAIDNTAIPMRTGSDAILQEIKLLRSSIQVLEGNLAKIRE